MLDQLARLNSDHLTFLAIMAGLLLASLTLICSTLCVQVRRFRQRQLELGFREEMLRRGLRVDEVVQLLNTPRPTWSQTAGSWVNRLSAKLASASRRLAEWTPRAIDRGCQRLRPVWNKCVARCHKGWQRASRRVRQAWQEVRPLVSRGRTAISRCAARLSDGLDALARRLTPHQP
jgi:hypothetical protein